MRSTGLPRFERHQRLHLTGRCASPANDGVGSALNLVRLPFFFTLAANGAWDTFDAREINAFQMQGMAAFPVERGKGARV